MMDRKETKSLKRRYLIWFYKVAKEAFDKVERKFTQVEVDRIVLNGLKKRDKTQEIKKYIEDFETYIAKKEKEGVALKFKGRKVSPDYKFLSFRLQSVEEAIRKELGQKVLKEIKALYESEMSQRISRSTNY